MALKTENGWFQVGRDMLDSNPFPGTDNSAPSIPLQRGHPNTIMKAFGADYHKFVESLYNGKQDNGGWTPTNSVWNSNHLSATAMDLNWSDHPFQVRNTFTFDQMQVIRELLDYYEGTIFWGGDWTSPVDEMHWQMGYNTHGNPHLDDFIARKIRHDGFSKYEEERRGGTPTFRKPVVPGDGGVFWNDVSQYQHRGGTPVPIDDSYPFKVFSFRTNSGDKTDTIADENCKRSLRMLETGQLEIVIPYYFFWPGQENCDLHRKILERNALFNHPRSVTMVDVEDAGGRITGNHSSEINDEVNRLGQWYENRNRVIGYYNSNASPGLWPSRGSINLVVPQYNRPKIGDISSIKDAGVRNAAIAHQFSESLRDEPPWQGINVDGNWSPYEIEELLVLFKMEKEPSIKPPEEEIVTIQVPKHEWDNLVNAVSELRGAVLDNVMSQSRYRDDGEGPRWKTIELIRNGDAMIHEEYVERLALLGSSWDIKRVTRNARRGDPIAFAVFQRIPLAYLEKLNINPEQIEQEFKESAKSEPAGK